MPGNVVFVQRAEFDPVDVERSLGTVGKLWFVSTFYVGVNRPLDVGPIPLHLTLWAIVTPFLLIELNRLRQAIVLPRSEQLLRRALVFGVASFASGILWGRVPTVLCLAAMVLAVLSFAVAMASLAETHRASDLAAQWRDTRHLITILALCWSPVAVMVLALGDVEWSGWPVTTLVLAGMASGAVVLLRLASVAWRTRAWLEGQSVDVIPAE